MTTISHNLDLHKFNSIIDEYSSIFQNPPKSTYQLTQFCKDNGYNYKYNELNPFFFVWKKQRENKTNISRNDTNSGNEHHYIDWESFWTEYEEQYNYPPKKAVHLWNFAKEEKMVTVKYKEARIAFDVIKRHKQPTNIEGCTRSDTDSGTKDDKNILELKISKYTQSTDIERIRITFLECFESFRKDILHDPSSALQLFNHINQSTKYKVRYGDVKSAYHYAVKNEWFEPKKRMKKTRKGLNKNEFETQGSECEGVHSDEGEGEYVLEIDHEEIERKRLKEEEKKEAVVNDIMNDDEFDDILVQYDVQYQNPPRNASQIMNFAKDIGIIYKYKACRIAFNRWKIGRGGVIPKMEKMEPGTVSTKCDGE